MFDFGEITPSVILREGYRMEGLDHRLRPIYISGPDYKGEPTEMFAYLGVPDSARDSYPVIILIHGGDGRANEQWTTDWVNRGFIALSIDNNSRHRTAEGVVTNPKGGPAAWKPWRENLADEENTWAYISTKTLLMAEGLLANVKGADMNRVYSHGISWGGYLSYLYLAHTSLIRLGAISYTTAYMEDIPEWQKGGLTPERAGNDIYELWVNKFDAKSFIPHIKTPVILARGMEDICFPPRTVNKTLELFADGVVTMANISRYVHGQMNGSSMLDVNGRICDDAFGDVEASEEYSYMVVFTEEAGPDSLDKVWQEQSITPEQYEAGYHPECASWYYNKVSPRGYLVSGRVHGDSAQ